MAQIAVDEAGVKDAFGRIVEAWDGNDADAFADMHTEGATVVTPGLFTEGRERIRAFMAGGFAGPLQGTRSAEVVQSVRFVTPDVAIVSSMGGFTFPGETEVRDELKRRATWVFNRVDGEWRAESYHNSQS